MPGINEQRLDGGAAIVYVENMPNNSGEEVWVTAAEPAQKWKGYMRKEGVSLQADCLCPQVHPGSLRPCPPPDRRIFKEAEKPPIFSHH